MNEDKLKPPLMPKPCRLRPSNSGPSLNCPSPTLLKSSHPVTRSKSSASCTFPRSELTPGRRSPITPPASTIRHSPDSAHRSVKSNVQFPSYYSAITLISSTEPVPDSPVELSGRMSSSTISSEPPSSPSGFLAPDTKYSDGQHVLSQLTHSPSLISEDESLIGTLSRIYPSSSNNSDPNTILISSPPHPKSPETLSLKELVKKHSKSFPLQIRVVHGYIGQTSQLSLASGDYYNIHFVKHQEVASMTDKLGLQYTIPLNSSFQFGLVYNEETSTNESLIFEKVSQLIALSPLPKVVCATRDVKACDEKNSLIAGELLVLKRVIRPKLRKKSLEVLSLKTQTVKTLSLDCEGHFSLNPEQNKIYLLELVRCIPDTFPCKAKMFMSCDGASSLQLTSYSLLHAVITLQGKKTETSLIASAVTYSGSEELNGDIGAQINEHLVDIPVDERLSGVMVSLVDTTEEGLQESLYLRTRTIFETFDVTRVRSWYDSSGDDEAELNQSLLYATIGRESKSAGIRVDKPMAAFAKQTQKPSEEDNEQEVVYETVYSPMQRRRRESLLTTSSNESSLDFPAQYEQPSIRRRAARIVSSMSELPTSQPSRLQRNRSEQGPQQERDSPHYKSLRRTKSHFVLPHHDISENYEDMHSAAVSLPSQFSLQSPLRPTPDSNIDKLLTTTTSLQTQLSDLNSQVSAMDKQLGEVVQMNIGIKRLLESLSALTLQANQFQELHYNDSLSRGGTLLPESSKTETEIQKNRLFVDSLDITKVECLLRAMGLPQYIAKFRQEQVTGSLLLQCNEAILQRELGVGSMLHCKRLMAIISGHTSAAGVISRY